MKNEKVLLNIQTKWANIANEILNAAIDAEQTFKCKWPYDVLVGALGFHLVEVTVLLNYFLVSGMELLFPEI